MMLFKLRTTVPTEVLTRAVYGGEPVNLPNLLQVLGSAPWEKWCAHGSVRAKRSKIGNSIRLI